MHSRRKEMYNILLVEDDKKIREVICDYFNSKDELGIDVHICEDGDRAIELVYENEYDLVLLDIMLPGVDGFTICKTIRRKSIVPIIFITARGREEDMINGYDLGCDDYIVKPFSLATLYMKVRALLMRSKGMVGTNLIEVGVISINPRTMLIRVGDEEINLPQKEYLILKILAENKNAVVTRQTLISRIWGYDYEGNERVLDNHMKKLRKALGIGAKQIKTVIGKGYKLKDE